MTLAIVLYLIICLVLVVFSLLQQGQSGGMGILGGSSSTFLGSEQASVMSRIVSFFAILFFVGAFFLNVISSDQSGIELDLKTIESDTTETIENMPAVEDDNETVGSDNSPQTGTTDDTSQ